MLTETSSKLLTTDNFTPTQVLLSAGIKDADTIFWGDLESAQHDLNILVGNNSAKIVSSFVNFNLEDATLSATFEFGASVNLGYFRVRVQICEGIHKVVCHITWDNKMIDYITVDTQRCNKNPTNPPIAMLRKLHIALERIGIPVSPLIDWVLCLNQDFHLGVPTIECVVLNQAALEWIKAPMPCDSVLIRQAQYVVSTFEPLSAIADREMDGVPFATGLGQTMRNHLWQSICQITAAAYGLSFDCEKQLWRFTTTATDDAWYLFHQKQFTTTDECNHYFGQLCANIVRTHRDLREALKDLL